MRTKIGISLLLVAATYLSLAPAAFAQELFRADLEPLNNSGASGTAGLALDDEPAFGSSEDWNPFAILDL